MRIVLMCPKCGLIKTPEENSHSCDICEYCKTSAIQIDLDVSLLKNATKEEKPHVNERAWRKFLYNNPEFDEEVFEKRLEEERIRHQKIQERLDSRSSSWDTPFCPYCRSPYVKKITTGERMISTAMFGLGSSKVGKEWHCQICKSNF